MKLVMVFEFIETCLDVKKKYKKEWQKVKDDLFRLQEIEKNLEKRYKA